MTTFAFVLLYAPLVVLVVYSFLGAAGTESRLTAAHGTHRVESNLVRALDAEEPKTFWGDIHGQTRATVGTGTIEEYFAFGRNVALLDMMCHQANDFQVTESEWQRLRTEIDRFHADGRCVIFVGYEWSGMTPGGGRVREDHVDHGDVDRRPAHRRGERVREGEALLTAAMRPLTRDAPVK